MDHEPGRLVDGGFRRHPRGGASTSHPTHKPPVVELEPHLSNAHES
jgi:hypothetical protein